MLLPIELRLYRRSCLPLKLLQQAACGAVGLKHHSVLQKGRWQHQGYEPIKWNGLRVLIVSLTICWASTHSHLQRCGEQWVGEAAEQVPHALPCRNAPQQRQAAAADPLLLLDTHLPKLRAVRWNAADENVVGVASSATRQLHLYDLQHTQVRGASWLQQASAPGRLLAGGSA